MSLGSFFLLLLLFFFFFDNPLHNTLFRELSRTGRNKRDTVQYVFYLTSSVLRNLDDFWNTVERMWNKGAATTAIVMPSLQVLLHFFNHYFYLFLLGSEAQKYRDKCDPNKGLMNTKEAMCCAVLSHCSSPGSSVHGILQARMLEWVALPSSRGSSRPKGWTFH